VEVSSQSNQTRKRKKMYPHWKTRKITFVDDMAVCFIIFGGVGC
jgi:hypothetical protein